MQDALALRKLLLDFHVNPVLPFNDIEHQKCGTGKYDVTHGKKAKGEQELDPGRQVLRNKMAHVGFKVKRVATNSKLS